MDSRADVFERDALRSNDHGVPGVVEVLDGVDQGLDVILDGDPADVDDHLVLGRLAQHGSGFVAID